MRLKIKAENAEATRFAIPLRTILTLLLSNFGKKNLEESLVRKKTKSFKYRKIGFFKPKRNWTKLIDSKPHCLSMMSIVSNLSRVVLRSPISNFEIIKIVFSLSADLLWKSKTDKFSAMLIKANNFTRKDPSK